MGIRPPPSNDTGGGPEAVDFGIAALDATLDEVEVTFPVTRAELLDAMGDVEVPYDPHGNTVAFATVLERTSTAEFDSERELLEAVHPIFEEYRTGSGPGFAGWLRDKLPF